jgi:hypothetical protein
LSCGYLEDTFDLLIRVLEGHVLRSSGSRGPGATDENVRGKSVQDNGFDVDVEVDVDVHEPGSVDDVWSELRKGSYAKSTGTPSTYLSGREISTSPCIRSEVCFVLSLQYNFMLPFFIERSPSPPHTHPVSFWSVRHLECRSTAIPVSSSRSWVRSWMRTPSFAQTSGITPYGWPVPCRRRGDSDF